MARRIVGIDIGSSTLRAVEIENPAKPRPTVLRMHEVALPVGAASRGEVVEPNTVAQAIKLLWRQGRFTSKDVVLGIGNQRLLARDFSVPKMPLSRIRESLPFEAQELLPVPVADALLDFYPVSESQGEHGPMVNGLLIAAVKEAVLGNVKAAQLAGLRPVDVDAIPFALSRAVIGAQRMPGTVALVAIGAHTSTVSVITDGAPQFVRIIPTGGADVTAAIQQELELDEPQAERIKRQLGLATHVSSEEEHRSAEVIYRVTNDLLVSVRNTVNYYVNTHEDQAVETIVLTGGGSLLPGLAQALGEVTRMAVVPGDPFTAVRLARSLANEGLAERRLSHAVALGLALGSAA
jgi:type IV pilus assembly protein PilM